MKNWVGGVLISGTVLLSMGACAPVGEMPHDMNAMIQSATTKADHEALAMHYEQEAKALQAKAAEHREMARAYAKSTLYGKMQSSLLQHCDILASQYQRAADENLELAKQHRRLAEGAPK
jgi:hypothetical protein